VWIYALDHGGRRLGVLSTLPHVGAVIAGDELERTTRLISLLTDQVARRSKLLADVGLGTLSEYNAAAKKGQRIPRIVVLIDNWQSLAATFEGLRLGMSPKRGDDWLDDLKQVVIDGRPVGVHLIIAGPSETGIATMVKGALGTSLQLRQSGDSQWGKLAAQIAELRPGQGLRGDVDVQLAVVGGEPTAQAMALALEVLSKESKRSSRSAPLVGVLPAQLAVTDLQLKQVEPTSLRVLFGASDTMVQPDGFDLTSSHAIIAGPRRRGKTTALSSCVRALRASYGDAVKIVGLLSSPPESEIDQLLDGWVGHDNADDAKTMLEQIATAPTPTVLVIDDAEAVPAALTGQLEAIARSVKPGTPRIIVTCDIATFKSSFNRAAWITEVIKSGQGVLLGPDAGDATLLGASATWVAVRPGLSFTPGRGVLVRDGASVVFQVCGR
jgi:S-DNA-T family DNA segregation ATPase FtsK/SpoIIIE